MVFILVSTLVNYIVVLAYVFISSTDILYMVTQITIAECFIGTTTSPINMSNIYWELAVSVCVLGAPRSRK